MATLVHGTAPQTHYYYYYYYCRPKRGPAVVIEFAYAVERVGAFRPVNGDKLGRPQGEVADEPREV